ncbi:hypothetical protein [Streptomyces sp. NPDC003996]
MSESYKAGLVRGHRQIEAHHVIRDMTFADGDCQLRTGNAARGMVAGSARPL